VTGTFQLKGTVLERVSWGLRWELKKRDWQTDGTYDLAQTLPVSKARHCRKLRRRVHCREPEKGILILHSFL
jgi:hypothetical protein